MYIQCRVSVKMVGWGSRHGINHSNHYNRQDEQQQQQEHYENETNQRYTLKVQSTNVYLIDPNSYNNQPTPISLETLGFRKNGTYAGPITKKGFMPGSRFLYTGSSLHEDHKVHSVIVHPYVILKGVSAIATGSSSNKKIRVDWEVFKTKFSPHKPQSSYYDNQQQLPPEGPVWAAANEDLEIAYNASVVKLEGAIENDGVVISSQPPLPNLGAQGIDPRVLMGLFASMYSPPPQQR